MKCFTTNQIFYKSKLPLFDVFCRWHEFIFLKKYIYVNKAILLIYLIFFIKFNNLIGMNILQRVFDFITYSIVT